MSAIDVMMGVFEDYIKDYKAEAESEINGSWFAKFKGIRSIQDAQDKGYAPNDRQVAELRQIVRNVGVEFENDLNNPSLHPHDREEKADEFADRIIQEIGKLSKEQWKEDQFKGFPDNDKWHELIRKEMKSLFLTTAQTVEERTTFEKENPEFFMGDSA
ncbi:MAG: hypothetical protein JO089_08080, partial [Alphaproteobacteria bacterium]|nr:hypothetical protein [Alphaproteobacteria bacterium]